MAAPTISSISPTSGSIGNPVVITGTNFNGTTGISFNGTTALTFSVINNTTITVIVPVGTTTGTIDVTTPDGTATSGTFTVISPTKPALNTSLLNISTLKTGLIGRYLLNDNTGTTVKDHSPNNFPGTTVNSPTWVTGSDGSPALQFASNSTVRLPSGINSSLGGQLTLFFRIKPSDINPSPSAALFCDWSGSVSNMMVDIAASKIRLWMGNASTGYNTYSSTTNINAVNTMSNVIVTRSGTGYEIYLDGSLIGNTTTAYLGGTSSNQVAFGGDANGTAPYSFRGVMEEFAVWNRVITSDEIALLSANPYSGFASASYSISNINPNNKWVGENVVITGINLDDTIAVNFNGTDASFTIDSSTQITAVVPVGATTGPINVITPEVSLASSTFTVTFPPPTITSITPTSGIIGTDVVITGTVFGTTTDVLFNGTYSLSYTVDSATQITATVPPGATTGSIAVITLGGVATSDSFTVVPDAPVISSFSPSSAYIGEVIIITGTNFNNTSDVSFNGTPAVSYVINSPTQITATVPSGASTGSIEVTTPGGTDTSPSSLTILTPPPTLSRIGVSFPNNRVSRTMSSVTTSSLASDAVDSSKSLLSGKSGIIYQITSDVASWIRIYSNSSVRTEDLSRAIEDPIPKGNGLLLDVIVPGDNLTIDLLPVNFVDSTSIGELPITVVNKSGGTNTVTVTINKVTFE